MRLAITDGFFGLGVVTAASAVAGVFDDAGDSAVLLGCAAVLLGIGVSGRMTFERHSRPTPSRVLTGLGATWLTLVVVGAGIYLATGAIDRVDDAVVEAAAGFSTTNVSTLDPGTLSVPMQLWRASTQWIGGLVGLVAGIIALPLALRGSSLSPAESNSAASQLVPSAAVGRRRITRIYFALTIICGLGFAGTGMGARHSVVHAMTTMSTGGFSSATDSFASFGDGPRAVATVGMIVAGSSLFIIWWAIRGSTRTIFQSTELRLYFGILAIGTTAVWLGSDGPTLAESLFTVASASSTTGFAVGDWTTLDDAVLAILLVIIATGSMVGSAGGGLRIVRASTLVGYARRELRRQLDPQAVVVLKSGGRAVEDRALERITGYQIAHLAICACAGFLLALAGVELLGALYTGISVVSTYGPGVGVGPYGSLAEFSGPARLLLVPFMLAGRLSVLPLMLGIIWLLRAEKFLLRSTRRTRRRRRQ